MSAEEALGAGSTPSATAPPPATSTLPAEARPRDPERSTSDLAGAVTQDLGELVGMHIDLAKTELKEELHQTVRTARLFGVGAFAAYMAVVVLSFALAALLAEWLEPWAGLAIVAVAWALAAAALVVAGRRQLQQIDAVPPKTVDAVKGDVAWAQQQRS